MRTSVAETKVLCMWKCMEGISIFGVVSLAAASASGHSVLDGSNETHPAGGKSDKKDFVKATVDPLLHGVSKLHETTRARPRGTYRNRNRQPGISTLQVLGW